MGIMADSWKVYTMIERRDHKALKVQVFKGKDPPEMADTGNLREILRNLTAKLHQIFNLRS